MAYQHPTPFLTHHQETQYGRLRSYLVEEGLTEEFLSNQARSAMQLAAILGQQKFR